MFALNDCLAAACVRCLTATYRISETARRKPSACFWHRLFTGLCIVRLSGFAESSDCWMFAFLLMCHAGWLCELQPALLPRF